MTPTITNGNLQRQITAEFVALTDFLGSATEAQWDTPSLCEGWRVREVVAHLTMPARYSEEQFMVELRACGFDFSVLSNKVAARDAALPVADLVANLASAALHQWTPPDGGQHGALNHVVIHSLDVTVPLDAARLGDEETIRVVLEDLTIGGVHAHFGTSIAGRRLEATDIDWSCGSGSILRGPAHELALTLCGRTLTHDHLEGAPIQ